MTCSWVSQRHTFSLSLSGFSVFNPGFYPHLPPHTILFYWVVWVGVISFSALALCVCYLGCDQNTRAHEARTHTKARTHTESARTHTEARARTEAHTHTQSSHTDTHRHTHTQLTHRHTHTHTHTGTHSHTHTHTHTQTHTHTFHYTVTTRNRWLSQKVGSYIHEPL